MVLIVQALLTRWVSVVMSALGQLQVCWIVLVLTQQVALVEMPVDWVCWWLPARVVYVPPVAAVMLAAVAACHLYLARGASEVAQHSSSDAELELH